MNHKEGDPHLDRERSCEKSREQSDNNADGAHGLKKHCRAGKGFAGNETVFRHHAADAGEPWACYLGPAMHKYIVANNDANQRVGDVSPGLIKISKAWIN